VLIRQLVLYFLLLAVFKLVPKIRVRPENSCMLEQIADEGPQLKIFLSVVFILLLLAVAAYFFLSSKRTLEPTRRRARWAAALVSTLVALFATMHFAIPCLEDFRNPGVPFRDALLGTAVVSSVCLSAWVVAIRCVVFALRR
jgi:hypothetical protein